MSRRFVAAALIATLLSACLCQPETPCTQTTQHTTVIHEDDDSGEMLAIGVVGVALLLGMIAIMKSRSDDDSTKPTRPPPFAARAADPSTMYFAPTPPVADEGERLRLQRMYVQGQVLARAGRCDGALTLGRQIARSSPEYYAMYAVEPVISVCVNAAVNKLSIGN